MKFQIFSRSGKSRRILKSVGENLLLLKKKKKKMSGKCYRIYSQLFKYKIASAEETTYGIPKIWFLRAAGLFNTGQNKHILIFSGLLTEGGLWDRFDCYAAPILPGFMSDKLTP